MSLCAGQCEPSIGLQCVKVRLRKKPQSAKNRVFRGYVNINSNTLRHWTLISLRAIHRWKRLNEPHTPTPHTRLGDTPSKHKLQKNKNHVVAWSKIGTCTAAFDAAVLKKTSLGVNRYFV